MPNKFGAVVGRRFAFTTKPRGGWDGVVHGGAPEAAENRRLVGNWIWRRGRRRRLSRAGQLRCVDAAPDRCGNAAQHGARGVQVAGKPERLRCDAPGLARKRKMSKSPTRNQAGAILALANLRMMRKARATCNHASADSIVASKSFYRRRARLIQPNVLSTTQRLGKTTNPLTSLSVRLTTVMAMRLASKAARCASSP